LTYKGLGITDFVHGITVFKELKPGADRTGWVKLFSATIEELLGIVPSRIVIPFQTHGRTVCSIPHDAAEKLSGSCDAVITSAPNTLIGITVADCIPLFAVNHTDSVTGLAHCGWRGIATGIVEAFNGRLDSVTACRQDTRYLVGASIGRCCYEVGPDLLERFPAEEVQANSVCRDGKVFFDLKTVVASRLVGLGVAPGQISIDRTCTSCQKYILSSFRASGTESGRMLAFAMFSR
jgi:YfiH family protein